MNHRSYFYFQLFKKLTSNMVGFILKIGIILKESKVLGKISMKNVATR